MFEKILYSLKPFFITKINDVLFKYDARYKALAIKLETILEANFGKLEINIKEYFQENSKLQEDFKKLNKSQQEFVLSSMEVNLNSEEVDNPIDQFIQSDIFKLSIKPYFDADKNLSRRILSAKSSVEWFKKVYDIELDNYINKKEVNISMLEDYKSIILEQVDKLFDQFEESISIFFVHAYKEHRVNLIKNPQITSEKLGLLHSNLNNILLLLKKKENAVLYKLFFSCISDILSENISLLTKKKKSS